MILNEHDIKCHLQFRSKGMTWVYHGIYWYVPHFRPSKMCGHLSSPQGLGLCTVCSSCATKVWPEYIGRIMASLQSLASFGVFWDPLPISWRTKHHKTTQYKTIFKTQLSDRSDFFWSLILVTWSTQGGSSSTDYLWRWKRNRLDFRADQSRQGSNPWAPLRDRGRVGIGLATGQLGSGYIWIHHNT